MNGSEWHYYLLHVKVYRRFLNWKRSTLEVKIRDHASDILAVEIVAGGVNVPDTAVGVVAVSAGIEDPPSSPKIEEVPDS